MNDPRPPLPPVTDPSHPVARDTSGLLARPAAPGKTIPLLPGFRDDICAIRTLGSPLPGNIFDYHRHDFFELFWITAGVATHYNDFKTYPAGPGTLIFVNTGQVHTWSFSPDIQGYAIAFGPELFAARQALPGEIGSLPFFNPATLRPTIAVPEEDHAMIDRSCERMLLEYTNRRSHREHSLRALLELILIQCDRHCARLEATSEQKAAGRITQEFCTLVERHFSKKHRVQDYARSLNISLHTLTRAVRTQNGRSPVDIINERLLLEARRLLLHSTQTVGEIAYQLGFKSPSNFGRFFKMHAHCSPGDLRQRQLTAIPPQT